MMNGNGGGPIIQAPSGPRMLYKQDDRQTSTDNQRTEVLTMETRRLKIGPAAQPGRRIEKKEQNKTATKSL